MNIVRLFIPYIIALITVIALQTNAFAQRLDWRIGLLGFADNREYKSEVQIPQSFLGTQFIPEFGVSIDSLHRIGLGVNLLNEFGGEKLVNNVGFQFYYQFTGKYFNFKFGSFSKNSVYGNAPKALYYDSLLYYRPNMGGLLWTLKINKFSQNMYLDWTSRQTDTQRETFIMGTFGEYHYRRLFFRNHLYMYHFAFPGIRIPNEHVRDNGVAYLCLGLNLNKVIVLDSLAISIGAIQSFERTRNVDYWHKPKGVIIEAVAEQKGFGISNSLYLGEGHKLDWGDPYYRLKNYNRLDIYFSPILFNKVKATFGISLHFAEGRVSHQQQFFVRVNINSSKLRKTDPLTGL
jgi:hypothetical protein